MEFGQKKKRKGILGEIGFPVLSFMAAVLIVLIAIRNFSQGTDEQLLATVEQNVTRSIVQCYALEGEYPPNIAYLEENYGLYVDQSRFLVHHVRIAGNLMPQIQIIPLGGEQAQGVEDAGFNPDEEPEGPVGPVPMP